MSETSNIAWTDSTHNFWRGCTKISPGCQQCYAETFEMGNEKGKIMDNLLTPPKRKQLAPPPRKRVAQQTATDAVSEFITCAGCGGYRIYVGGLTKESANALMREKGYCQSGQTYQWFHSALCLNNWVNNRRLL